METISQLSRLDFFAFIGIMIFLIAIGFVLPAFIVKEHTTEFKKKMKPEIVTKTDLIIGREKE